MQCGSKVRRINFKNLQEASLAGHSCTAQKQEIAHDFGRHP